MKGGEERGLGGGSPSWGGRRGRRLCRDTGLGSGGLGGGTSWSWGGLGGSQSKAHLLKLSGKP